MLLNCGVYKTLESPLDCKEIHPVHPKADPSWVFIGRTDAEAETPILWPPDAKSWLIGKDPDAGQDWRQEEKGMTEDEMVGWHHWLYGHEFGQALGVGDGQGSLVGCSPRATKSRTWLSDWTELNLLLYPLVPLLHLKAAELFLFPCRNSAPIMRPDSLPELTSQRVPPLESQWRHRPASAHCPQQDMMDSAWVRSGPGPLCGYYILKELFKKKKKDCDRDHM